MRSKGFTLIELLAVIVILAIIALIATPIVLNIIDSTRNQSNEASIEMYAKAVQNAVAKYYLKNTNNPQGSYEYLEETQTLIHKTDSTKTLDVEYDGAKVECSTIEIYEDGNIFLNNCKVNDVDVDYVYGAEKITVTSTQSSLTIETNKSAPLENYRIYGSSNGVGDSSDSGYVIPVTVRGNNLFNLAGMNFNSTYSAITKTSNSIVIDNTQASGANYAYTTNIEALNLKPSTTYTSKSKVKLEIAQTGGSDSGSMTGVFYLQTNTNFDQNNTKYAVVGKSYLNKSDSGQEKNLYSTFTTPADFTGYNYLTTRVMGYSTITFTDIILVEGSYTESTFPVENYQPYREPTSFNILLTSPLMEGDYIDFKTQSVVRSEGTIEQISVPTITTLDVPTTIIEVKTTNAPSSIEAIYIKMNH